MMRELTLSSKTVPSSRIHISSTTTTTTPHYLSFQAQPPRPPCWQDFIGKKLQKDGRQDSNVSISVTTDSDKKHKTSSSGHRPKYKKSSTNARSKGISSSAAAQTKLKRTRSEPCIAEKEIPAEATQIRLTTEQLSKQSIDEAKRYLEDTYLKCSQWLAQISPGSSIPLEDTDFQVGSGDILTCDDEVRKDIDYHAKRHSLALDKIPE